jgi:hypothetical protein
MTRIVIQVSIGARAVHAVDRDESRRYTGQPMASRLMSTGTIISTRMMTIRGVGGVSGVET